MISLLALGFLIGMRHALEADHLAAVATLVTRTHSIAGAVSHGIAWGMGHTLTLFVLGSLVLLLDVALSETLAHCFEVVVGIMLVALGIDVIRRVIRDRVHVHSHSHRDGTTHLHVHAHPGAGEHDPHRHDHPHRLHLPLRALLVGLMHGMAGSAALILVTVGSVNSAAMGLGYMALFGLGSVIGMAVLSVVIAVPMHRYARPLTWMHNGLHGVVGAISVGLGVMVLLSSGRAELLAM